MASRLVAAVVVGLVLHCPAWAEERTGFIDRTYTNPDGSKTRYALFVPHNYNQRKAPVPVILFLHGSGEAKGGKKQPVDVGIGQHIRRHEKTFPFLVVFPQSEGNDGWAPKSRSGQRALAILDDVIKVYQANPKRVYLTGLSLGGGGTWQFAAAYPNRWAAIVPICGYADPKTAPRIKDIPCWAFHGVDDDVVPISETRQMIAALKKAGGDPQATYFPKTGHGCWDQVYGNADLWKWLSTQKRT